MDRTRRPAPTLGRGPVGTLVAFETFRTGKKPLPGMQSGIRRGVSGVCFDTAVAANDADIRPAFATDEDQLTDLRPQQIARLLQNVVHDGPARQRRREADPSSRRREARLTPRR